MDKKNIVFGTLCVLALLGVMMWEAQHAPERVPQTDAPAPAEQASAPEEGAVPAAGQETQTASDPAASAEDEASGDTLARTVEQKAATEDAGPEFEEETVVLENKLVRVVFTNRGGAIKEVVLKDYRRDQDSEAPYVFNRYHEVPALAIGRDTEDGAVSEYAPRYEVSAQTADSVEFRRRESNGLEIVRSYHISNETEGAAPYVIAHSTNFLNSSAQALDLQHIYFNVGTAAPDRADQYGQSLNAGWFDGEDYDKEGIQSLTGSSGFMGFFAKSPQPYLRPNVSHAVWASVKNQFFTGILTPDTPGSGVFITDVEFPVEEESGRVPKGITSALRFDLDPVAPGEGESISATYYAGPKEYDRLAQLEHHQDRVMQFGWGIIGVIGKFLLWVINSVQSVVINWGVAIIVVTVLLRLAMWPLTAKAAKSAKRMQKVAGPMKELREKYSDNPQKLQKEMMNLYKKHKVNPAAGCVPLIFQFPIFIAFFYMLRSASELRFADFLWINDLSLPDTVATVAGLPVNILPLIMGVTMFFQMRLQPTPATDNAQMTMLRFMPFIFLIFMYNFSSGLVLYWTTSNIMTIIQQTITNRSSATEDEEVSAEPTTAAAKAKPVSGTHKPLKKKRPRKH